MPIKTPLTVDELVNWMTDHNAQLNCEMVPDKPEFLMTLRSDNGQGNFYVSERKVSVKKKFEFEGSLTTCLLEEMIMETDVACNRTVRMPEPE